MKAQLVKRQDRWDLYIEDGSKIASSAPNPIGKLLVKNCEAIERGYDYDLDEIAKEYAEGKSSSDVFRKAHEEDFIAGFKKALEIIGDKKFNYGHLDKMFTCGKLYQDSRNNAYSFDNVLSKFEQTEFDIEIEMTEDWYDGFKLTPKLDSDGCLILKRI